ncbi:hypothetical protein B0H14DRAFT_2640747 [Mycena olivaceomarginata]|nr:hypothetical protein B0H14DRAFT_2640747 [Mycena olivaceomarginata]
MSEERQYCSSCKLTKTVDQFRIKTNGTRNSTCLSCNLRTSSANRERRLKEKKENLDPAGNAEEDASRADLAPLPLKDFLDALKEKEEQIELEARVNIASISGSRRDCADGLAKAIWKCRSYRFVYHSKYDHKRTPA